MASTEPNNARPRSWPRPIPRRCRHWWRVSEFCDRQFEVASLFVIARRPVGKGIPMAKPRGPSTSARYPSLMAKGNPISAEEVRAVPRWSGDGNVINTARGIQPLGMFDNQRRESRLPAPLAKSKER